ncbi:MAG TPA: hypothetical protein VFB82_08200, partial [Blastocatellia bacterium]|nr:hypothetical protein [Blastocatellia bacterium]
MSPQVKSYDETIKQVRARITTRALLLGVLVTVAVAAGSLLLAGWAAGNAGNKRGLLILLRVLPIVVTLVVTWLFLIRPLRTKLSNTVIARLIEEKCGLADRLVTTVEYNQAPRDASPAILSRLNQDTTERCATINLDEVVDRRRGY